MEIKVDKNLKGGIQGLSVWATLIYFSAGETKYVYVIVRTAGN